jgi:acyl carrier protein
MTPIDDIAARSLARLIGRPAESAAAVDFDADLFDQYGLTSLKMMLLITSICDEADGDLSRFTEDDVATMRTLRGIVARLEPAAGGTGGAR